jgi:hypothetical protein
LSAHWIKDPDFQQAIARFLTAERNQVAHERATLTLHGPFKKAGDEAMPETGLRPEARDEDDF